MLDMTVEILTVKARSVLERNKDIKTPDGSQVFSPRVEADELPRFSMVMAAHVWQELGKPNRITVTAEPGDRLNGAD